MRLGPLRRLAAVSLGAALACGGPSTPARDPSLDHLRPHATTAPLRATLGPARYIPAGTRAEMRRFADAAGGRRALVNGVRVIELPGGGELSAAAPLPAGTIADGGVVELPSRLGGGFLFLIGSTVYRADDWLAPAAPIFASPSGVSSNVVRINVGLDRVYLQLDKGAWVPVDPRGGQVIDLGTFPRAPFVTALVTLDGWQGAALADGRGLVVTTDAGATWRALPVDAELIGLERAGDRIVLRTRDQGAPQWWDVNPEGRLSRLPRPPTDGATPSIEDEQPTSPLGANPLAAAIEDGWPLSDGTALVARDGALGRVRIADGALVEVARDAFPLRPSRCHPFSLARPGAPGAFGFACGAPRGATEIYAYDEAAGAPVLLRRFDGPRVVGSSGNGAIWIRGACAEDSPSDDASPTRQTYCLRGTDDRFVDFVLQGELGAQRVVVLSDGRRAVVSPPQRGNLAGASVTVLDHGKTTTRPLLWAPDPAADREQLEEHARIEQALRNGTWLESFEERKPGKLSGWVVAGRTTLGVEISVDDGHAKHGAFVDDLGPAIVSGAYGIAWAAQGHETTDGGMTWRQVDLPVALAPGRGETARACGPLGCEVAGWLRVGWGAPAAEPKADVQTIVAERSPAYVGLHLQCELTGKRAPLSPLASVVTRRVPTIHVGTPRPPGVPRPPDNIDWQPLFGAAPPKLADEEFGYGVEGPSALTGTNDPVRSRRTGDTNVRETAHLYAWGPRSIPEWEIHGRASVRYASPFEGTSSLHTTQAGPIPRFLADAVSPLVTGGRATSTVDGGALAFDEDGSRALWKFAASSAPLLLEPDRGPTELRRADGSELPPLDSAVHAQGRWYLASASDDGPSATVVWEVEAGNVRELARVPRVSTQASGAIPGVRLARRSDGRAVGVVIDGQPSVSRFLTSQRWVVPIDLATGQLLEPEPLGPADSLATATRCRRDAGGWVMDVPYATTFWVGNDAHAAAVARAHFDATGACVERIVSTSELDPSSLAKHLDDDASGPSVAVSTLSEGQRVVLRCR